jgi:hypothetical protein
MVFQSFKKRNFLTWKMGTYIETFGRDFINASIGSQYGKKNGSICETRARDCDSDTNDDYLDEYEWGWGLFHMMGEINLRALWNNRQRSGAVGVGCTVVGMKISWVHRF